jgi:hypothetical protein
MKLLSHSCYPYDHSRYGIFPLPVVIATIRACEGQLQKHLRSVSRSPANNAVNLNILVAE